MRARATLLISSAFALLLAASPARAIIVDFESLAAGHIVTDADLPDGVGIVVVNNTPGHPSSAITFDSSCVGGCTGGDGDLRTPGTGPGNDTAQGNILIIAEDVVDVGGDGLVDDPDDEQNGGVISFTFDRPHKLLSVRVIDIEEMGEFPSLLEIVTSAGGTELVFYEELGNNSAQTVVVPDPKPADALNFVFESTGAIDDLEIVLACGDGVIDPGEDCDPPNGTTCDDSCMEITGECGNDVLDPGEECDGIDDAACPGLCRDSCVCPVCGDDILDPGEDCDPPDGVTCDDSCMFIGVCGDDILDPGEECDGTADAACPGLCRDTCVCPGCGDGMLDPGEECDPPASQGGAADCTDQCTLIECGDSVVDPPEECDPPASQGGDVKCNDDCTLAVCGDEEIEGDEECDPPESQGGMMGCSDECMLPECGDSVVDPPEECDPPASQGGDPNCNDQCMLPLCGDGIVEGDEICDPPESMGGVVGCQDDCRFECGNDAIEDGEDCDPPESQGGEEGCNDDCTLAECGDGVVDPGEECDPPAVLGGDDNCHADCTIGDICGNGVLNPGEECEQPIDSEICDNGIDDDFDTFIDCGDPDCAPPDEDPNDLPLFCDGTCRESQCLPIKRDPAIIRFADLPKHDFFSIHGRVDSPPNAFDPRQVDFRIMLANVNGSFLDVTVPAGAFQARTQKLYFFKDKSAKQLGADSPSGGMFKASMRFRRVLGTDSYTFKLRIYGDFSGGDPALSGDVAELSLITTLVYGVSPGSSVGFLKANWNRTRRGWTLRLSDLAG